MIQALEEEEQFEKRAVRDGIRVGKKCQWSRRQHEGSVGCRNLARLLRDRDEEGDGDGDGDNRDRQIEDGRVGVGGRGKADEAGKIDQTRQRGACVPGLYFGGNEKQKVFLSMMGQ